MKKTIIKPYKEIEYKIYGYTLPEVPTHKGYVKIGDTTREVSKRIFEQVGTAGLNPEILFEKLAKKSDGKWFRDKELHRFLLMNGVEKKNFNNHADEWFYFDQSPEKAEELTNIFINRDYDEVQIIDNKFEYELRNEQKQAVEKTIEYLNSKHIDKEYLWNAKPRFGKTLTSYDFIRKIRFNNALIVTNRPAIANSWFDDFQKFIAWQEPQIKFVSETDSLNGKAMSRSQYVEYLETTNHENPAQITFISLQDLKGAKFAGGPYDKLEWISGLEWDVLIIDEAHEGIETNKTDRAFSQIKRKFTLHLSGTPFKAIANNRFKQEQIFNWSYIDEQEAKNNWEYSLGNNPYENLPTLNLFTYQMSKMIENEVTVGLQVEDDINVDYAFDLNEFFRVKDNGEFEYEESVLRFLDNLTKGKFPFSDQQYRNELNHTFWLLPRVKAAKALEKLLKSHPTFKDYTIVLAAGDGLSLSEDLETEALDLNGSLKSFDKVRKAIESSSKTITLSVGQLTTGITVPEWTAVFMLNNIESPSLYFQAAFRSQNPFEFEKNGTIHRKENAYIFDFSPDRTLRLYNELANNLSNDSEKTGEQRKKNIKKLLNFFPVIAEDEAGSMHEISALEVLTIPTRITSKEVVKRGFMSNLLFANIAGIFSSDSPFKEILNKISPEKNKRLDKKRDVKETNVHLNKDGEIEIPNEVVIGKSKDIFGDKIYAPVELVDQVAESLNLTEESQKESIKYLARDITKSFTVGFNKLKEDFNLNKGQTEDIRKKINSTLENKITETHLTLVNKVRELEKEYEINIKNVEKENNESKLKDIISEFQERKKEINMAFTKEINHQVENTVHTIIENQMEKVEEKKKKTTEEDVRDHLRGFARTIPAFLMAYGDSSTQLDNFEINIDNAAFEDLTSITKEEFKKLRDGFEYEDDCGVRKIVPGLFNEVVFNASIQEFLDTKKRLANYFDEKLEEDIFDFIPPQKTNQIFTPKTIVKKMVNALEEENFGIYSDKNIKFIDLYTKSGLYITEIVKKLNEGLKEEIPNQQERIKWILENQVYACAPSNIIYNIVKNFVFNDFNNVSFSNLIQLDTLKLVNEGKLKNEIYKKFGVDKLKFDVIIGNPPYQDETIGDNKTYAPPIYHKFLEESYQIADKVEMIHPARFLFNAGSTPKSWNKKMLEDDHLKIVKYYENSTIVFPNTDIKGGIVISYRDANKKFGKIGSFIVYEELNSILEKIQTDSFVSFNQLIYAPESYKFSKKLHEEHSNVKSLLSKGHENAIMTNIFDKLPFIFLSSKTGDDDYLKFYGRQNNERVFKWIKSCYVAEHPNLYKYKVFLPKSNGNGTFGETLTTPILGEPMSGHTQTFISIGDFNTQFEAESVVKYLKTKFLRALLGSLKVTQDNKKASWFNIPLQDFTKRSDIDWTQSVEEIDNQLFKKYSLSNEEINFIKSSVKKMN